MLQLVREDHALGALVVLIAGLYVRTTDVQYPPPSKQRDMMAELKSYRAACHIAAALLEQHRTTTAAFRRNLDDVRNVSTAGITTGNSGETL